MNLILTHDLIFRCLNYHLSYPDLLTLIEISPAFKKRFQAQLDFREAQLKKLQTWLPARYQRISLIELINLRELYRLWGNQIREIPTEIGHLTNLRWLDLGYNQIQVIPVEIGQLTNLRGLYLCRNQIQKIPTEIGQLTNLEKLALDNNQIQEIPTEIGQLTNLRWLDLRHNQIQAIPAEITALSKLRIYR